MSPETQAILTAVGQLLATAQALLAAAQAGSSGSSGPAASTAGLNPAAASAAVRR